MVARALLAGLVADGLSDAAIGDQLGLSARTVIRWRQRYELESQWSPELVPCPSQAAYERGCRCAGCRAENSARVARLRRGRQDRTKDAPRWAKRWTPAEDETLSRLGPMAAALELGRTYDACANRANLLARLAAAQAPR